MQAQLRASQCRDQRDANSAVFVVVADDLRRCRVRVEHEPVIDRCRGDVTHEVQHLVTLTGNRAGLHIDIAGRPAFAVCGEQQAALEHQLRGVRRRR